MAKIDVYTFLMAFLIALSLIVFDFIVRVMFSLRHQKTHNLKKAMFYYKSHYTFFQRMMFVHIKASREKEGKNAFIVHHILQALTAITEILFFSDVIKYNDMNISRYFVLAEFLIGLAFVSWGISTFDEAKY